MEPTDQPHGTPDDGPQNHGMPTDAVIAERDHLRAMLCHAEVVRHLLTVAIGHLDLAGALEALNVTLVPCAGVELTAIAAVDLDAATSLGADLPHPDEEPIIDDWQVALDASDDPQPVAHDAQLLVPAVEDDRIVGLARSTPTGDGLRDDTLRALQSALGDAICLAAIRIGQPDTR